MKVLFSSALLVALVLGNSCGAHAQDEVTLIAPGGIRAALEQLIPGFETKTGHKVKATFGSGNGTKQQVVHGDAFDVPVVQPPYADVLASGNVVASSATPLASVAVGVAVKKGAPKPDISTPEAVKRMLLAAKSIAYPDAAGGAAAMTMAAKGEVEIGLTFLSEMNDPGIDVVGPLPREISTPTSLVGFVSAHAKDAATAKALLEYLSSPEAAAVYKAHGMQPGR